MDKAITPAIGLLIAISFLVSIGLIITNVWINYSGISCDSLIINASITYYENTSTVSIAINASQDIDGYILVLNNDATYTYILPEDRDSLIVDHPPRTALVKIYKVKRGKRVVCDEKEVLVKNAGQA